MMMYHNVQSCVKMKREQYERYPELLSAGN